MIFVLCVFLVILAFAVVMSDVLKSHEKIRLISEREAEHFDTLLFPDFLYLDSVYVFTEDGRLTELTFFT